MLEVNLLDEKGKLFTTVELEDDLVEKIEKLGMTIEEGINAALDYVVKNPDYFEKILQLDKKFKEKK
jgi:hypothetical protein